MADNTHRCLFEMEDGSFCMEAVAAHGLQCHLHTRVQEPAVAEEAPAPRRRRAAAVEQRTCRGIVIKTGRMCGCKVKDLGFHTCGMHRRQEAQVVANLAVAQAAPVLPEGVQGCPVRMRTGLRAGQICGKACNAEIGGARVEHTCKQHRTVRIREIQAEQDHIDDIAIDVVAQQNGVLEQARFIRWSLAAVPFEIYSADPMEAAVAAARRALAAYNDWNAARNRGGRWAWLAGVIAGPVAPAAPLGDLGRLANDRQNVHTGAANKIIADANKELEAAQAIDGSLAQIRARFAERNFGTTKQRKEVYDDMNRFYSDAKVMRALGQMEDNDYGYKRLLDKVWGLIQTSKHKDDMEQRLWEEAVESVGMCTQGHMARLANVLQGFDVAEAPKLEIPKGERLQAAMAQINELPQNERESAARRVFAELEVAEGEQGAWLEALEVA